MAYTADPAIGTDTTLNATTRNADAAEMVAEAVVSAATLRDGARLRSSMLEHPEHDVVVSEYCGHVAANWWGGGGMGTPIVFEDDKAPEYTGSHADGLDGSVYNLLESQNFINTIALLQVPIWNGSDAATPKLRMKRLGVSCVICVNDDTLEDSAASNARQFASDADVAAALTVRVHRVEYETIRRRGLLPVTTPRVSPGFVDSLLAADFVSEKRDATRIGSLTGMSTGPRMRSTTGTVATAGMIRYFAGSADATKLASSLDFRLFHVYALLGPGSLAARQNLAPGDAVLVSITGSDRLIYAGEGALEPTKRNVILPVRGRWAVGVFAAEHAG